MRMCACMHAYAWALRGSKVELLAGAAQAELRARGSAAHLPCAARGPARRGEGGCPRPEEAGVGGERGAARPAQPSPGGG